MTSPKNATTARTGQRYYSWRGENYWSVTTILGGGLPKPALINWAKKFTAEYAVDNLTKLATLLEPDAQGEVDREGAVDWLKNASFRERDRAADLGTLVHAATEAYVLGKPYPKWPPLVKPRMEAFERFLADFEPEYTATEASVYSRAQRYAGTLDAIATIDGRTLLLDTKTSKKAIYPDVALQLAAYRYADFIGLPDGSEEPMRPVDACAALRLADGEYELIDVRADRDVFQVFLFVREVFRWTTETSKSVLLGPVVRAESQAEIDLAKEVA
jgi:hypothetical protein